MKDNSLSRVEFTQLLQRLADGWNKG